MRIRTQTSRDASESVIVVRCETSFVEVAPHKWMDVEATITSVLRDHPAERASAARPGEEAD